MQRKLTQNKKCKSSECDKRFDQIRFGQTCCDLDCAIDYARQQREKKVNIRAKNKRKDNPEVYYKENKKQLQDLLQMIARLIDKGVHCIDCDRTEAHRWDGGHYVSKGSNKSISLNLHNIFMQSGWCNNQGQTSNEAFLVGINKMYGDEYGEYVDSLTRLFPYLGLKVPDYPKKITTALKIVRELKSLGLSYTSKQRIKLRTKYNKRLGIYLDKQ